MKELQSLVAQMVAERGYREGWTDEQYAARQICKVVEELDELTRAIRWARASANHGGGAMIGEWAQRLSDAAFQASCDFDSDPNAKEREGWDKIVGVDLSVIAAELPDVIIPLLVLAETLGIDLEQRIREKVLGDVARGVRDEEYEEEYTGHICNNCDGIDPDSCVFNPDRRLAYYTAPITQGRLEEIGGYVADLFANGDESAPVIDELLAEVERLSKPQDEPQERASAWSNEPPTEPGFYWWRKSARDDAEVVQIKELGNGALTARFTSGGYLSLANPFGKWWPEQVAAPQGSKPQAPVWVPLSELRPGAIFETQDGVRAVKSEYRNVDLAIQCVLLGSGKYAHFHDGNATLVREIVI